MFIFKTKCKNLLCENNNNNKYVKNEVINHGSSVNEWQNSIYSFNKKYLLKTKDNIIHQIFNSYFNSIPTKFLHKDIKRKWLSNKRIFISRPEIKHSIDNVIITVYTFNRYNFKLIGKLKKLGKLFMTNGYYMKKNWKHKTYKLKINSIYNKLINNFSFIRKNYVNVNKVYSIVLNLFNVNRFNNINSNIVVNNILKEILIIKLKKLYLYKYNATLLYMNNFKFNLNNLLGLMNILNKIYNKKVILNIINLKYLYLDNSILAEAIVRKVNDRRKRIKKVLIRFKRLAKKYILNSILKIPKNKKESINMKKNNLDNKLFFDYNKNNHKTVYKTVHSKYLTGIKLQGTGRLTKRLTASRSILKYTIKGSLKNVTSSFQKSSSTILKGNIRSNVQYLNINSKNRNGSFGIKSWSGTY